MNDDTERSVASAGSRPGKCSGVADAWAAAANINRQQDLLPVAWAVMNDQGVVCDIVVTNPPYVRPMVKNMETPIPLYGSPTLTDVEKNCLGYAIRKMDAEYAAGPAGVLRGLLERLG
jgi:hypothetical protein